jgi:hypothetical protein
MPESAGAGRKTTFTSLPPNRPRPRILLSLFIVFCSFKFFYPLA